ncbi:PHD finger protein 10 [Eumeta japonica]|uniref:PHD finger protein 10 n=1 Tax=Eumeta variegata TaxID=151549 RepID=A0A4C1YBK4_EUMVA|nr:PHD finger protein 10 [Eumeta japonica]
MQEIDSTNTSTASSDVVEIVPITNSHLEVQEMLINENSNSHEFNEVPEEVSQDPLDIAPSKASTDMSASLITESSITLTHPPMTPQPRKRGRPRKLPVSEGPKTVTLPVPALEERPQRSLRLSRVQPLPTALVKPRGRGRGRGIKRALARSSETTPTSEPLVEKANKFFVNEENEKEVEASDLAMKLPRLTEALEKMPSVCSTPLSSRKDSIESVLFSETPELKVMLESIPKIEDSLLKSPDSETPRGRGRGGRGRGSRGGRILRTPRGRGRRGGGRGAMYMKETMGIYGRVCGPATTTIELFEEETCMMDDNATPAKLELMDEDSQSSIKSSTNDSNKMKKSKFADLFESNKVWTASDVKEYMWPPPNTPSANPQVMMIQEQVAMFLGVKSFKRSYPELKRRAIIGEERDYVLSKEIVTEAFCDLGVTAVDASEVLDIMLSDYPHKYEEYRSYQRRRQLSEPPPAPSEPEPAPPPEKVSEEKPEVKPDTKLPEIKTESIPEKNKQSMQDLAAAAITAASEWNTRLNALRRPACVDLQTMTVHKRRVSGAPLTSPRVQPPAGFYPHALLPGQYQHWFRVYTPEQLSYFPLNTVLEAPPPPVEVKPSETSSESEGDWGSSSSSDESDNEQTSSSKRKKAAKPRSEAGSESRDGEDKCNKCGLREEATKKYSHEKFLACANCNAKVHPSCLELGPDTVRKCRAYAWQCAECKSCGSCARPADDDKMLFCDLCDRGFHIYCVGLSAVPSGRWHCVECSVCKSCGARTPAGLSGAATAADTAEPQWHHQSKRGPGGVKIYSHSLCAPCAR